MNISIGKTETIISTKDLFRIVSLARHELEDRALSIATVLDKEGTVAGFTLETSAQAAAQIGNQAEELLQLEYQLARILGVKVGE